MRSIRRTAPADADGSSASAEESPLSGGLARDIALVCLADGLVGVSFGAIAVGAGFPIWLPMLLSVVVFAGASQFMFVAIIGAGGNPVAAVVAGLLVNARHLPFGLAVGDAIGHRMLRRIVGSHLIIDESTAFAMSQTDPRRRRAAFWACGLGLFVSWNVGVVLGAFGGTLIKSTDALGMDAAFPAVLLALLMPSLRDRAHPNRRPHRGGDRGRDRADPSRWASGAARPGRPADRPPRPPLEADVQRSVEPHRGIDHCGRGAGDRGGRVARSRTSSVRVRNRANAVNAGAVTLIVATVALGLGTFAFRFAGVTLRSKLRVSTRAQQAMTAASVILLVALTATSALLQDGQWAGIARPAGVAVGGLLAWRKAPFVVVVLAAAGVAAGLRLLGIS